MASLRAATPLPLEVHLMIADPDLFIDEFVEAGTDWFVVHWEGNLHLHRTVRRIRSAGKRVGVAINPATPAAVLEEIVAEIDQVLVMTVDPGFGHQPFLDTTLPKIRAVREMLDRRNPGCDLEVDGGIDAESAGLAVDAGANVLVAGTSVFGNRGGIAAGLESLRAGIGLKTVNAQQKEMTSCNLE